MDNEITVYQNMNTGKITTNPSGLVESLRLFSKSGYHYRHLKQTAKKHSRKFKHINKGKCDD